MKIVLLRHGRPKIDLDALKHKKLSSCALGEIIEAYKSTDLHPDTSPPENTRKLAADCEIWLTSDMPRSISSARLLGVSDKATIDRNLREADLPYLTWHNPVLRLITWSFFYRIVWLLGFSRNAENIQDAQKRALQSAAELNVLSTAHGSVLVVGHGIMNRLIARKLKKTGWRKTSNTHSHYWSHVIFERDL